MSNSRSESRTEARPRVGVLFAVGATLLCALAFHVAQNRFALGFRTHAMKTAAGRAKKIEGFVEMLKRGETIYPNGKAK